MSEPQKEQYSKPIIGVFIFSSEKLIKKGPLNSSHALTKANERIKATLFFFTRRNVDTTRKCINGYVYEKESGGWIQKEFPYPDVVYNRNVTMGSPRNNHIRESFRKEGVTLLNPVGRLDKWEQFKIFERKQSIKKYLPETVIFTDENLRNMLYKYEKVYVKGTRSGQGRHVFQVIKTAHNEYQCSYYRQSLVTYTSASLDDVIQRLKKMLNGKEAIIQQKIESLDRKVDLRIEAQRNKKNDIEIVGAAARSGQKEAPILNTRSGPSIYNLENFFIEQLKYSKTDLQILKNELTTLVNEVFLALEERYGTFVEMGIDIMLSKDYKLYLIESNATPGRTSIYRGCGYKAVSKAFNNVLDYIKWCTKEK